MFVVHSSLIPLFHCSLVRDARQGQGVCLHISLFVFASFPTGLTPKVPANFMATCFGRGDHVFYMLVKHNLDDIDFRLLIRSICVAHTVSESSFLIAILLEYLA
jgi:hypothetical protein